MLFRSSKRTVDILFTARIMNSRQNVLRVGDILRRLSSLIGDCFPQEPHIMAQFEWHVYQRMYGNVGPFSSFSTTVKTCRVRDAVKDSLHALQSELAAANPSHDNRCLVNPLVFGMIDMILADSIRIDVPAPTGKMPSHSPTLKTPQAEKAPPVVSISNASISSPAPTSPGISDPPADVLTIHAETTDSWANQMESVSLEDSCNEERDVARSALEQRLQEKKPLYGCLKSAKYSCSSINCTICTNLYRSTTVTKCGSAKWMSCSVESACHSCGWYPHAGPASWRKTVSLHKNGKNPSVKTQYSYSLDNWTGNVVTLEQPTFASVTAKVATIPPNKRVENPKPARPKHQGKRKADQPAQQDRSAKKIPTLSSAADPSLSAAVQQ